MRTVHVKLPQRSYDILIEAGMLRTAQNVPISVLKGRRIFVVTDQNVVGSYMEPAKNFFDKNGATVEAAVVLDIGESQKSFVVLQYVVEKLLDLGIDRQSVVVALGGGVVGDIAGFAASMVMRGVDFVQMPTTLLAQVDSSVGGKTGINTAQGKNLAGAFYQPLGVLIDPETLKTLPKRELLAGYAEVLKYSLINDPGFFDWLDERTESLSADNTDVLAEMIQRSCQSKATIVAQDEKEQGIRALLNLGHTFGHALEALAGYDGRLLHGEAVAIGMLWAFRFSEKQGLCPSSDVEKLVGHYEKIGLPTGIGSLGLSASADEILSYMKRDKKAKKGHITLILAKGIGQAFQTDTVADKDLAAFLEEVI